MDCLGERLAKCMAHTGGVACEFYGGRWICNKRGPLRNFVFIAAESCPEGKWGACEKEIVIPAPPPAAVKKNYVAAILNILWFLLRKCRSSLPVRRHRLSACNGCEHRKRIAWLRYCGQCGCWLRAKIGLTYQRCPIGKWEAVKDESCKPPLGLRVLNKGCCNGGGAR